MKKLFISFLSFLIGIVALVDADTSMPLHNAYAQDDLDMRNHAIINLASINGIPISSFNTGGGGGGSGTVTSFAFTNNGGLVGTVTNPTGPAVTLGLALGTPSGLSVSSTNSVSGTTHSHAITTSSDPGAAASILATNSSGDLTLMDLKAHGTTFNLANTTATTINTAGAANARFIFGDTSRAQSTSYASQTTGWGITGDGSADFRYLYTDELHAKAFIADLEEALAGGQIICKSVAKIQSTFTVPAANGSANLNVEDFAGFPSFRVYENNDLVRVRQFNRNAGTGSLDISDAWGLVTYVSHTDAVGTTPGYQTYVFLRAATGSGSSTAGSTVPTGGLALDYGKVANKFGYWEVNAADGSNAANSPYAQVVTAATSPAIDRVVRTRIGNLKGISNVTEYGLFAGNVAGGSTLATSNRYVRISDTNFELNNLDLNVYNSGTRTIALNAATPYISVGSPAPTGYLSGSGFWVGNSGGTYKLYLGTVSGSSITSGLSWDGTTLSVRGAITVTGGNAAKTDLSNLAGFTELTDGRIATALDSSGTLVTKVVPASVAAPGASGLYLGSDRMGFYNGSAWKTYMDNSGNFYLGGTSGALQWNGSTLTINGGGTFSGALSAATGSFAGALSAATGSFSGAINASSGTFTGAVSVGSGSFSAGGGNVSFSSNGLNLTATSSAGHSSTTGTAITWGTAGNGEIVTDTSHIIRVAGRDAPTLGTGISGATIEALPAGSGITGLDAGAFISLVNDSSIQNAAYARIWSTAQTFTGLVIGSNAVPTHMLDVIGTGYFSSDLTLNTKIASYNGTATVSTGIPAIYGTRDIAPRNSGFGPVALLTPATTGFYRVSATLKITTVGTSPVAGPITITYSDGDGSVAQSHTMPMFATDGSLVTTTVNNSTTTGTVSGELVIYAVAGTAINVQIGASGTFGSGMYAGHVRCEAL